MIFRIKSEFLAALQCTHTHTHTHTYSAHPYPLLHTLTPSQVEDDEDDIEEEDREATTDSLIVKLQDLTQIFDQKNKQYLDMEAAYEECKKVR